MTERHVVADRGRVLRLARQAGRQYGAFTRQQALASGFTRNEIARRRANGAWVAIRRSVYAVAGSPDTWERRAVAAVLAAGPGAALSHLAAAWMWRLVDRRPETIDVTVPRGHKGTGHRHRARKFDRSDVRVVSRIPVTCVARTIVDLAGVVDRRDLEAALDRALLRGLVTTDGLRIYIHDRRLRHHVGAGTLMNLIVDRCAGVPEGELERRFLDLVRGRGLPLPVRQHWEGRRRIDFAYVEERIAIELDGFATHGSKTAFESDRRRQNELVLAGWFPLRFTWLQVTTDPDGVGEALELALRRRAGGGI